MADMDEAPVHPIAPRLKEGPKKPHVGPHIDDYRRHHAVTVGEHSDAFWAKVCVLFDHL